MVGLYGMSDALGRVRILTRDATYLGADGTSLDAVSGRTVEALDGEVRRLINAAEARARAILGANPTKLEALATALQDEETLEGDALATLLSGVTAPVVAADNGSGSSDGRPPARAARGSRK